MCPPWLIAAPAHRQNGGKLNHDLEQLALLVVPVEQAADDDQVTGARDRQEFGQSLDDAEKHSLNRNYKIHVSALADRRASTPPEWRQIESRSRTACPSRCSS